MKQMIIENNPIIKLMNRDLQKKWESGFEGERFYCPKEEKWLEYTSIGYYNRECSLAGNVSLHYDDQCVQIANWAGGPPVWEEGGRRVAFPIVERTLFNRKYQRIVIVDCLFQTITVYKDRFTELRLEKFNEQSLHGVEYKGYEISQVNWWMTDAVIKKFVRFKLNNKNTEIVSN